MKIIYILSLLICILSLNSCTNTLSSNVDSNHSLDNCLIEDPLMNHEQETVVSSSDFEIMQVLSDEDIIDLLDRFLLYEMYTVYDSLHYDYNQIIRFSEGPPEAYKVIDEKYDTWDEWISFMESIFCDDLLEQKIDTLIHVRNIDGYTYTSGGGLGWMISKEYNYNIVEYNKDTVIVSMKREDFSDEKNITVRENIFKLHYTNEGWRIHESSLSNQTNH